MLTFDHALLDVLGRDARDALVDGRPFTDAEAVIRLLADCAAHAAGDLAAGEPKRSLTLAPRPSCR